VPLIRHGLIARIGGDRGGQAEAYRRRHGDEIRDPASLQPIEKRRLLTVASVTDHRLRRHASGKMRGKRFVWGGRAPVRAARSMAALVGVKHNPVLRAFYTRLRAAGKVFKIAITACMRKLLTILNAMVRHNQEWDPQRA